MAYGINATEANTIGNGRWQNTSIAAGPATVYIELDTTAPTDSAAGTKATYGSYVNIAVTCNTTNFPAFAAGATTWPPTGGQNFATSTGTSNTITDACFQATLAGGVAPLYWGDLSSSQVINTGNTPTFPAGSVTISYT